MSHRKRIDKRDYAYGYVDISYNHTITRGVLYNKSEEGIAAYFYEPLEVNANIEVMCYHHWEGVRQASVMWCEEVGTDLYRVGLSFN